MKSSILLRGLIVWLKARGCKADDQFLYKMRKKKTNFLIIWERLRQLTKVENCLEGGVTVVFPSE